MANYTESVPIDVEGLMKAFDAGEVRAVAAELAEIKSGGLSIDELRSDLGLPHRILPLS